MSKTVINIEMILIKEYAKNNDKNYRNMMKFMLSVQRYTIKTYLTMQ